MRDYIALTKPRITWLILMSTGVGYFFGASGVLHWPLLIHTLIGTGLIASGTAALNQWYERDADLLMRRTSARPLPSGKMTALIRPEIRDRAGGHWIRGTGSRGKHSSRPAGRIYAWQLSLYLHAAQAAFASFHRHRRAARGHAAADGLCRIARIAHSRSLDPVRDSFHLAIPSFSCHCLDVSRRLRAGRHPDAACG